MLGVGDGLAMVLLEMRGFGEADFAALHPGGELGRRFLKGRDLMRTGDRVPRVGGDPPMAEAVHEMSRKMMGIPAGGDGKRWVLAWILGCLLRRVGATQPGA